MDGKTEPILQNGRSRERYAHIWTKPTHEPANTSLRINEHYRVTMVVRDLVLLTLLWLSTVCPIWLGLVSW